MARFHLAPATLMLLGLLYLVASPNTVTAHSTLQSSQPAAGAVLAGIDAILLTFDKPIRATSTFALYDSHFAPIALDTIRPSTDGLQLQATIAQPPLAPGNYSVQWLSVSTDGDTLRGQFGFRVQPAWYTWAGWAVAIGAVVFFGMAGAYWYRRTNLTAPLDKLYNTHNDRK